MSPTTSPTVTGQAVGCQHGASVTAWQACRGGAFVPDLNRMHFVPSCKAPEDTWHYVNGVTGDVVGCQHGVSAVSHAYFGRVFTPTLNRVCFVPNRQPREDTWHHVDGATGGVVGYQHPGVIVAAFDDDAGGVFSPIQNRACFAP